MTPGPQPIPRHALGLGLRLPHYADIFDRWPEVGYFEIISENFLGEGWPPRHHLERLREHYQIVLHGVGLNLLGSAPLDLAYLDKLAWLAEYVDAPFVTDHLCWTGAGGFNHHDLLPTPYVADLIGTAAERAAAVQRHVGRPLPLPPALARRQFWLLARTGVKLGQLPLEPLEARLLTLLDELSLSQALAVLERSCTDSEAETLVAGTERWLANSVERGFWCGIDDGTAIRG